MDDDEVDAPQLVETAWPTTEIEKKIPVTVLCGCGERPDASRGDSASGRFLGAGKSTLVSRLVSEAEGRRIAVVLNELGETGGLESIIAAGGGVAVAGSTLELRNGCVCCSVKDELAQNLEEIARRVAPDAIVLELSGAANPAPVAASFWLDESLEAHIELDCVACVVDAANASKTLSGPGAYEATRQIACADRIVLSKIDLCSDSDEVQRTIVALTSAEIRRAVQGAGLANWLLETGCYGSNAIREVKRLLHSPGAFGRRHETPFEAIRYEQKHPLDPHKFKHFLGRWLWPADAGTSSSHDDDRPQQPFVFRVKGLVALQSCLDDDDLQTSEVQQQQGPYVYLLQGVYDLFDLTPLSGEDGARTGLNVGSGFIVFIGVNLPRDELAGGFVDCYIQEKSEAHNLRKT